MNLEEKRWMKKRGEIREILWRNVNLTIHCCVLSPFDWKRRKRPMKWKNSPSICRAVNRNWRRSSNELCASAAKNEKTETLADLVIFPIMDYCKHTSHRTQYRPTQCELITEKRAKCRSKRIWFRLYFPSSSLSFFEIPLRFSRQKWHWKKGGKK